MLAFGFNHDAASAVEDVKLQKPSSTLSGSFSCRCATESSKGVAPTKTNQLTSFLLCSPLPKWQWGGLSIFRIRLSFGDDNDSHVEELIALTGDYRVAKAAFDEAVKRRPGRIVTLRQKTRLLADSRRR